MSEIVIKYAFSVGRTSHEVFLEAHAKYAPKTPRWKVEARYAHFVKTGRAPRCVLRHVLEEYRG